MWGLLFWYSSKYENMVYHVLVEYKSLCKLEHNKQRKIENLDIISESPPKNRRLCKICESLL